MRSLPPTPWIHIGECPCCVNGLCRIRSCEGPQGKLHLYALCDECEALWTEPNTDTHKVFPSAENPHCPICEQPLYGPQAHWSQPDEVTAVPEWSAAAIFELPSSLDQPLNQDSQSAGEVVMEDLVADLDAPVTAELGVLPHETISDIDSRGPLADSSYGQDDPKPGC